MSLSMELRNVRGIPVLDLSGRSLKHVNLYHTLVTEAGVRKLRAALPECKIEWDRDSAMPNRRKT